MCFFGIKIYLTMLLVCYFEDENKKTVTYINHNPDVYLEHAGANLYVPSFKN
jgi:hypothetical protein